MRLALVLVPTLMLALALALVGCSAKLPSEGATVSGSSDGSAGADAGVAEGADAQTATVTPAEEEVFAPSMEIGQGVKKADWYVDNDGNIFYFGKDGEPLTGWQYLDKRWFHFAKDGAAIKGWTTWQGSWRFCSEKTGAMVCDNPVEGAYWADGYGSLTPVAGIMEEGGSRSWTEVSGTDLASFVAYLTAHANDYLGTAYDSWPCSVPGVGMHCVGFVDRAFYDAGFGDGFWNDLAGTGYERYFYNNGYMYRADEDPYTNENCWHVGGWAMWVNANDIHWRAYATHEDAMAGAQRGEFQKGDIIIYSTTSIGGYDYSGIEHIAIYWGDENDWSLIWESSPEHDNAIVDRSEYACTMYVLTST